MGFTLVYKNKHSKLLKYKKGSVALIVYCICSRNQITRVYVIGRRLWVFEPNGRFRTTYMSAGTASYVRNVLNKVDDYHSFLGAYRHAIKAINKDYGKYEKVIEKVMDFVERAPDWDSRYSTKLKNYLFSQAMKYMRGKCNGRL